MSARKFLIVPELIAFAQYDPETQRINLVLNNGNQFFPVEIHLNKPLKPFQKLNTVLGLELLKPIQEGEN